MGNGRRSAVCQIGACPWFSASFCDCEALESLLSSLWPRGCAALAQHSPTKLELPVALGTDACPGKLAANS